MTPAWLGYSAAPAAFAAVCAAGSA